MVTLNPHKKIGINCSRYSHDIQRKLKKVAIFRHIGFLATLVDQKEPSCGDPPRTQKNWELID
jgi:hypothetical protein